MKFKCYFWNSIKTHSQNLFIVHSFAGVSSVEVVCFAGLPRELLLPIYSQLIEQHFSFPLENKNIHRSIIRFIINDIEFISIQNDTDNVAYKEKLQWYSIANIVRNLVWSIQKMSVFWRYSYKQISKPNLMWVVNVLIFL